MTKPRKPGVSIPEAQRHTVQLKLRVSAEARSALEELAVADEEPASRVVEALIEGETKRRSRRAK